MKEIAAYVAANCGTKLSYQKTADAYGLGSLHTARNYLSYFEEAYLFFGVEMFSSKIRQKVRAPRKMYGIDPALIRATGGSVDNRGLLLENLVYLELLRRGMGVHYFAEANGASEVDFLCSRGNRKPDQLIQVCLDLSREETREREFRGLVRAAQALGGMADEQLLVLTYGEKGTESAAGRRIRYMPVWEWCLNPS
jgi:predicted AAA+ superfamily ATPase